MSKTLSLTSYLKFSNNIRYVSAKVMFDTIKSISENKATKEIPLIHKSINNFEIKDILKLKIIDEFIASTEDFTMWLLALKNWKSLLKESSGLNFETFLLQSGVTKKSREQMNETLETFSKIEAVDEFISVLDMPSLKEFTLITKSDIKRIHDTLERILKIAKFVYFIRKESGLTYLTLHNRIKHGLVISRNGEFKKIEIVMNGEIKTKTFNFNFKVNDKKIEKYCSRIWNISFGITGISLILINLYLYKIRVRRLQNK